MEALVKPNEDILNKKTKVNCSFKLMKYYHTNCKPLTKRVTNMSNCREVIFIYIFANHAVFIMRIILYFEITAAITSDN